MRKHPTGLLCICDFETTGVDTENDWPIEVGMVLCREEDGLRPVAEFSSLIAVMPVVFAIERAGGRWPDPWLRAFEFHAILAQEVYGQAQKNAYSLRGDQIAPHLKDDPYRIVREISDFLKAHSRGGEKIILVSDNAAFEMRFMRRLFQLAETDWPFHYCAWDTSLLLEWTGVGDPADVEHRALSDAYGLHAAMVGAFNQIEHWRGDDNQEA